ncbi:MAG: ABC transporter permease [Terriglobales bacterium]
MSTVANVPAAGVSTTQPISAVRRRFYWSVRRELWENRYVYIAPLVAGAVFLLGFVISLLDLIPSMRAAAAPAAAGHLRAVAMGPYDFAAALLMLTTILVGAFYSIEALYGERRDRSILFWKSMPVSDWTTVLSKAAIPMLLLPLFGFAAAFLTHVAMAVFSVAITSANSVAVLPGTEFFRMELLMLYHFITVHALWPAPIFAWFLLVSAWSRRAPFLWAVLPPVVVCALEKVAFNTTYLTHAIGGRLFGEGAPAAAAMSNYFPTNPGAHMTPGAYLASFGLWAGLAISAMFLFAAARLRREQDA